MPFEFPPSRSIYGRLLTGQYHLWVSGIYFSCVFAELKCNALTCERQAEFAVFFKNLYNSKKYIDEFFYDETVQLFHVESFNELYPKHKTAQGAVLSPPVQYFCISALLKLPTPYLSLSRIIKNAIDRASSSGRYLDFSSQRRRKILSTAASETERDN